MIEASINRLDDLVSMMDNCERRLDEALDSVEHECTPGLDTTSSTSTFDSNSSMSTTFILVGSLSDVGQVGGADDDDEGSTCGYYWNADGDLVRKDKSDATAVGLEECLEKERYERERLERAREVVRVRREGRVGC